jgi:toxin-antitoxin system PIN domain toxin
MTVLLDANVLIALVVADHVHHEAAESWLAGTDEPFATCPITQGSLVRLLIMDGERADLAVSVVREIAASPRHEFWADHLGYDDVPMAGVIGHRQVTDAYLAALARAKKGRLATFDGGMAALHSDVADLLPARPE